jgi:Secretion system C-terminal sorting domain
MEKRFTFHARTAACTVLTLVALVISSVTTKTFAQLTCQSETVLFSETFGTGTTPTSNTDVIPAALTFQGSGMLVGEGVYRVIDSTQQKPEWQVSGDHTGDANGKMLVINGTADTFYSHRADGLNGFRAATYIASMFLMNLDVTGTCSVNPLLPAISIRLEYLAEDNTWQPLTGSPYAAPGVAQSANPTWVQIGSTFILPSTGSFLVKSMRVLLVNRTAGGCGNDFALDDIKLSFCPNGALPVEFLGITARQKGSGVSVEWSTAQETNTKSFIVEKSASGSNFSWDAIATINAAGNSSAAKSYNAYDSKPFNGVNFYRVRQVDKDGNFKYSRIVSLKVNFGKAGITVLTNPFHNSLTIDFSSSGAQVVSAKLVDITGKQVASEKWSINSGTTRKEFSNVSSLQQGMYIFTVSGAGGEILYNNKVIKQ